MIKIYNKKETTTQNIFLFSEDDWEQEKSNYPNTEHFFNGKKSEVFIKTDSNEINFFIGIGRDSKGFEIQNVANKFANDYKKNLQAVATSVHSKLGLDLTEEFVKGLFLGTYLYPFERSHPFWQENFELYFENISDDEAKNLALKTEALCNGQFAGMEWLNKPANYKKVDQISEFLKSTSEKYGLKYKSLNREESIKEGLGAFVAVNQGSSQEASFTILEYKSEKENAKTIGLVGKCVLFDTGGISIKGSANLHYMKSDMGGASAVIGALITASELKLPVNIIAILPITDNAVSEKAYLPSDVITAYSGKTIEVLDTDAEGRMTLADGLSYLSKNYETDVLIDLATLTGSSVRMFGYTCGAYFSNNDDLKKSLEKSADKTNQRLWNLPLWDVWKDDFTSDVADFKNISMKPFGDCIVAAKFLEQFIEGHQNWAHLDIAGVAFGNVGYAKDKAATGYGVQLLLDFIENYN
ncbi:M17 family metallopeptidase [Epilithonimonas xixisoli]|uniref:Leucyl aminopeptidase n=1 Tax=Epilithonimonas xixisoli TaxID=1476462 RepID=A0A4R8I8V0_9FLAO|nr:leucyl aminopeptidase family protein [Epilithonimonas xixisoli]TDX86407.1 leucyl aminopeptidase [Epilithonimonas xixisoli]